jgi:hypothetical protein
LACLAALVSGCGHPPPGDPQSAANAFFATLEKGDARSAYDGSAFGFQAAQTYDAFSSNAQQLGLIGGQPPTWSNQTVNGSEARLDGLIVNHDGQPVNFSVTLTLDGGQWKLFSLNTGNSGASENPFSLVGKGTDFNDVYHQPMPDPQELTDLTHETMRQFCNAIRVGNFHQFYRYVSREWKDGARLNGQAASQVTEEMLKNHFQGFIDKKIDLSASVNVPPVWDKPPLINSDGLLALDGHFNIPKFTVQFRFEYVYELPHWRLFGMDIGVMQ